jgi:hypothetical protein
VEGLKSFAVELSCVDTTDMIFSWIEKEILGMEDNNGQTRQHRFTCGKAFGETRGSYPPFQELEEGFDDWVRELRSILQTQENPLAIPCIREKANQKRGQRRSKII